jgi:hypothetical protein
MKSCRDGYISEWYERKDRDDEADSSKDNEASSNREMVCKNKTKYRKYKIKDLSFGFRNIDVDGEERPQQCLLCMIILALDSKKPNKLKRHLKQ